ADRRAVESPRRYADDRQRDAVDDERASEDLRIALELALPVRVAQHDGLCEAVDAIVLGTEQPAEGGLQTEQREIAPRDEDAGREPRLLAGRQRGFEEAVARQPDERRLLALEIA